MCVGIVSNVVMLGRIIFIFWGFFMRVIVVDDVFFMLVDLVNGVFCGLEEGWFRVLWYVGMICVDRFYEVVFDE